MLIRYIIDGDAQQGLSSPPRVPHRDKLPLLSGSHWSWSLGGKGQAHGPTYRVEASLLS